MEISGHSCGEPACRLTGQTPAASESSSFVVELDALAFLPLLNRFKSLLPYAEKLADWADSGCVGDRVFGRRGAELLHQVFVDWMRIIQEARVSGIGSDSQAIVNIRRREFVQCLQDLALTVFSPSSWDLLDDGCDYTEEGIFDRAVLTQGAALGMQHSDFVKRVKYIIGLLNKIVPRQRVRVVEADRKARELTDTPKKKSEFLALSETEQAKKIGCCWATYSKTRFYNEAREKGLLPSSQRLLRSGTHRPIATRRLTRALEATTGDGDRDKVLCELAEAEEQEQNRRSWHDLSLAERQAIAIEQDSDLAADPSPLDSRRRRGLQR
jgi:hypothetical protein